MKKLIIPLMILLSSMLVTSCNNQDSVAEHTTVTDQTTIVTDTYIITKTAENTLSPSTVTTTVFSTPYLEQTEKYSDEERDTVITFMDSLHTPDKWTLMDKRFSSDRGVVSYFVMDKEVGGNTHDNIEGFLAEVFNVDKETIRQYVSRQDTDGEGKGMVSTGSISIPPSVEQPGFNIEYYVENNGTGHFSESGGYADFTIRIDKD